MRKACQIFGVEKLFSQQFEALKTFVSGTERKSSPFHLVHSYVAEMVFFRAQVIAFFAQSLQGVCYYVGFQ